MYTHRYCIYCYRCIDDRSSLCIACEDCIAQSITESKSYSAMKRRARKKHCDQSSAHIGAIVKAAAEAGMTYGKYVSKGLDKND